MENPDNTQHGVQKKDQERRRAELQIYLDALWSDYSSYHNHKENMAHLALAAQVGLACVVVSWEKWPSCPNDSRWWICLIGVFVLWLALFLYARWEMRLRRYAATMNEAILRLRGRFVDEQFIVTGSSDKNDPPKEKCSEICRALVWPPTFKRQFHYTGRGYPTDLLNELKVIKKKADKNLDALELGSWILSMAVLTALIIVCLLHWWRQCQS
jgi:hypothetical protein